MIPAIWVDTTESMIPLGGFLKPWEQGWWRCPETAQEAIAAVLEEVEYGWRTNLESKNARLRVGYGRLSQLGESKHLSFPVRKTPSCSKTL